MSKSVIVFPGQGSQHRGMLAEAPESDDLLRLLDAAEACSGLDLRALERAGTAEELADTRVAQPLLYLAGWAWGRALLDVGVRPDVVAGHSLGELTALAIAGVFSVEAGLELVCARSHMMAEATVRAPGTMAAVLGMDAASVSASIAGIPAVWVANDNSPAQVVISGSLEGVEAACESLATAGARKVIPLTVSGGFHTPIMDDAAARFSAVLDDTEFHDAAIPVIQNVRPLPTIDSHEIRSALKLQMSHGVRWTEIMEYVATLAPIYLVEAGPGKVLRGLARGIEGITPLALEGEDLQAVVEEVVG